MLGAFRSFCARHCSPLPKNGRSRDSVTHSAAMHDYGKLCNCLVVVRTVVNKHCRLPRHSGRPCRTAFIPQQHNSLAEMGDFPLAGPIKWPGKRWFDIWHAYLSVTVPSACRSYSSNAYRCGSAVLPGRTLIGRFGLPADLRRYSSGPSSLVNEVRECFGCNDRRPTPKLSPANIPKAHNIS